MLRLSIILWLAATSLQFTAGFSTAAVSTERVITCFNSSRVHPLSCERGVINLLAARAGLADRTTCSNERPIKQLFNTICTEQHVLNALKERCDGKSVCDVNVNIVGTDTCREIYKYLDTKHICTPGVHSITYGSEAIFIHGSDSELRDRTSLTLIQNANSMWSTSSVAGSYTARSSRSGDASSDPCAHTVKFVEVANGCQFHTVVCEGSMACLKCVKGQVIGVYSAVYGRSDQTICSSQATANQVKNVNCDRPNTKVGKRCDGKKRCVFRVSDSVLGHPCRGTYKYLDVVYGCFSG